jgi:uncharacterized protein
MRSLTGSVIFMVVVILLELYVFQAFKTVSHGAGARWRGALVTGFWAISLLSMVFLVALPYVHYDQWQRPLRTYLFAVVVGLFLAKLIVLPFLLIDDLRRLAMWLTAKWRTAPNTAPVANGELLSRSAFLSWLGLGVGATLFGTLLAGFRNMYRYQVRQVQLAFPNLPHAFRGLKLVQISDIHSGSFTNVAAVARGVALINAQKPDLILFTGDLVNDRAEEMEPYMQVFNKLHARLGVYSTMGNHDYGDYVRWADRNAAHEAREAAAGKRLPTPLQARNIDTLMRVHEQLGWRLLNDEHVVLEQNGAQIALVGVQNISGKARFHSYGNLQKALNGTAAYPFKILMSHDPSHWEKEVKASQPDVDLMLSGHTHGMQFGVEIPGFKWSPVKWVYRHWAGLYEHQRQKLYVNRGFGVIGYPGRVGIMPEITVLELV